MLRRRRGIEIFLLAGLLFLVLARIASADELNDRTRQIAKQLQCPVCESVSVADSPSELAGQMRAVIRQQLEAGQSQEQILQYFVARYGDQVLVEPPRHGLALLVWWAPVALGLGGLFFLTLLLRGWARAGRGASRLTPAAVSHPVPGSLNGNASSGNGRSGVSVAAEERGYEARARAEFDLFRRENER